jgi:protein-S-isoprenylcysteine O-methyltransferase Ste14
MVHPAVAAELAAGIVFLSWAVFIVGFILRPWRRRQKEKRRDSQAMLGFFLEAASYAIVFSVRRDFGMPFLPLGIAVDLILDVIAALFAVSSVWCALAAISVLGKHWSPSARIIEGHELVTEGPYRIVRHPIYAAMLGLMIATALVISKPWALCVGIILYIFGTALRIRTEERLLLDHFGKRYEEYRSNVPALIPYVI